MNACLVDPLRCLAVVGEESGEGVSDRDAARIRHMAIHSMIQATADQKARIANDTKTRRSGELLELREGDLVEFYRKPITKDASGWHGPAEVVNPSSLQDGVIYVKWQGRFIAVRIQDIRTALIFATFLMKPTGPIRIFKSEAESQTGHALRVGWLRQGSHWTECQANRTHSIMLEVGLYVAAVRMHLQGVIGFRFGAYLHNLPAVSFDDTLLLWWKVGSPNLTEWCHCFLPGNQLLNVPKVCGHSDVCVVQFFMVDVSEVMSLRQVVPDIPHLGGQYEPDMPHSRDCTDEVLKTRSPKQIKNDNPPDNPPVSTPLSPQAADASQPENAQAFALMDLAATSMPSVPSENDLHYVFDFRYVMSNIAYLGMSYDPMPMCSGSVLCGDDSFVTDACELDEPPVFSFAASMTQFVTRHAKHLRAKMSCDNLLSFVYQTSQETVSVIERVNNILTRSEALSHVDECRESMILELMRWERHGAWKRGRMDKASNVLKSKWVLKWKDISDGTSKSRKIKARLVAQGFLDRQTTDTFAGTSTRWGQRLLIAIAVQQGWSLWSADISEAFLRGLTFKELHEEGGELRQVQISLPPGSEHLLRTIPGYEDYNPQSEVLVMLKPGFGLKDAPRLWLMALKRVLGKIGVTATQVDQQLFCMHQNDKLILLMAIHVDDIKLCGVPELMKKVVSQLESHFDSVKLEKDNFVHLGLQHSLQEDGSITVSQSHYIAELREIPEGGLRSMGKEDLVDEQHQHLYRSLLGGVAWVTQTRLDC